MVAFFVNARFRLPLVGPLIIFAALAIVAWLKALGERRLHRQVALSVAAAVLTAVVMRPLPALRVADAQAFFHEAAAYRSQGDYADAADWYRRALDAFPGYCDAAYNLARIHTEVFPEASRVVEILEPVIAPCAEDVGIRLLLGRALCAVGRCDEGSEHLRIAGASETGIGDS